MRYLISILLLAGSLPACAQSELRKLESLIGTWDVEETHTSGWSERGVRTCGYIMDSTYIQCETLAVSSLGRKRTYRFLFNYNSQAGRYELLGFYSNWPLKQLDVIVPGGVWTIGNSALPSEDVKREGTLQFESMDSYTWRGKNTNTKKGTVTEYVEKGVRRK